MKKVYGSGRHLSATPVFNTLLDITTVLMFAYVRVCI